MLRFDREAELHDVTQWDAVAIDKLVSMKWVDKWDFASGSQFESGVLTQLVLMKGLLYLSFENSTFERENMRALAQLRRLRRLGLNGCRFDSDDFLFLCEQWAQGASPKLTTLWLIGTSVGDQEARALGQVNQLRSLLLRDTSISEVGVEHLLHIQKLDELETQNFSLRAVREQLALKKSEKPFNVVQADTAGAQLHEFLGAMEKWERSANKLLEKMKVARIQASVFRDAEERVNALSLDETYAEKATITAQFCSARLLQLRADCYGRIGNPPHFQQQEKWLGVETPSARKTIFYGKSRFTQRYTMVLDDNEWKLDAVHYWSERWNREIV